MLFFSPVCRIAFIQYERYNNPRYFSYHFYKTKNIITIKKIECWWWCCCCGCCFFLPSAMSCHFLFKIKCMVHGIFVYVHPSMCHCYRRRVLVKLSDMVLHRRRLAKRTLHLIQNLNLILIKIHKFEPIPFEMIEWVFQNCGRTKLCECNEFDLDVSYRFTVIFIASWFLCVCDNARICLRYRTIVSRNGRERYWVGDSEKACLCSEFATVHITRNTNHNYYFGKEKKTHK